MTNSPPEQAPLFTNTPAASSVSEESKSSDAPKGKVESEALRRWRHRHDRLDAIPLTQVLEALGASPVARARNKWKLPGVGNMLIKGQGWLNGNTNKKDGGAVKLTMHAQEISVKPAMAWLAAQFPDALEGVWVPPEEEEQKEVGFSPPEPCPALTSVIRDYLVGSRCIPSALVDAEIAAGRIYANDHRSKDDETGEWSSDPRVVFVGPASAELRSVDPDGFKGCCTGSASEHSGYQVMFRGESDRRLGIVEAAIDALSYNAMYPNRYVISTNGAGRFHLQLRLALESWRNDFSTDIALDADPAGDLGSQLLFNALLLRDKLSREYGVQPSEVDEWFLTDRMTFSSMVSPHQLFWSQSEREDKNGLYPVVVAELDQEDRTVVHMRETGESLPPTVVFNVARACGPIKPGKHRFEISREEIAATASHYRVNRDRPKMGKDWNEIWKKLSIQSSAPTPVKSKPSVEPEPSHPPRPTGRFVRSPR